MAVPYWLRELVEQPESRRGRIFEILVQVLILGSIITFSLSTLEGLSPQTRLALRLLEGITIGAFTGEYLLRLLVAESRAKYALSFFGLIDLLAILPFYLSLGLDLRSLRAVRLLRVVRALKLLRYSRAIRRLRAAFQLVREELVLFLAATLLLLYFSAVGIYYCEHEAQPEAFRSILHSLWWAVTTLTTVGYGDLYPVTVGGKLFTFLVLLIGLGTVAVPSGMFAAALAEVRRTEAANMETEVAGSGSAVDSRQG